MIAPNNVVPMDVVVRLRAAALYGHLVRAENSDPARIVTFAPNSNIPVAHRKCRVGKPRTFWQFYVENFIWSALRGKVKPPAFLGEARTVYADIPYNNKNVHIKREIWRAALDRKL